MDYEEWKKHMETLENIYEFDRVKASYALTEIVFSILKHIQPERSKREDTGNRDAVL